MLLISIFIVSACVSESGGASVVGKLLSGVRVYFHYSYSVLLRLESGVENKFGAFLLRFPIEGVRHGRV